MEMRLKCPKLRQNLHYVRILDTHGFQRIYTANEAIYAYIRRYAYTEYRTRNAYITALVIRVFVDAKQSRHFSFAQQPHSSVSY